MNRRPIPTSCWRKRAWRLAGVVVLGSMLTACDKCGDWWFSPMRGETQICREQGPKPQ